MGSRGRVSTDVMVADVGPAEFAPGVEVSSRAAGVWPRSPSSTARYCPNHCWSRGRELSAGSSRLLVSPSPLPKGDPSLRVSR